MGLSQVVMIVAGVAIVGGIICAVAYSSSHRDSSVSSKSVMNLKPMNELIKNQEILDELNISYIANWFKSNTNSTYESNKDIVKMLAYPTRTVLNGFGYEFNPSIDKNTNAFLCFANKETGTILKHQWVAFKTMNGNIKDMFDSDGDFILFDD